MKTLLVVALLTAADLHGEEARPESVREKLKAKILESVPLPPARKPAGAKTSEHPIIMMKPVVVEAPRAIDLGAALARDAQKKEEEKFSPLKGGTIYTKDFGRVRAELGGWWSPTQGWSFLRFSW